MYYSKYQKSHFSIKTLGFGSGDEKVPVVLKGLTKASTVAVQNTEGDILEILSIDKVCYELS